VNNMIYHSGRLVLFCLALIVLSVLSGCGSKPRIEYQIQMVEVPVLVPCIEKGTIPPKNYVDTKEKLLAATPDVRYQLLYAGRVQREERDKVIDPVISICEAVVDPK